MARLPNPGSDDGTWGQILNDFLLQAHNADGTLKPGSVHTTSLSAASPSSGQVLSYNGTDLAWATPSGSGSVPDASTTTKGLVQLAGDLAGTAAAPTVPGLAAKEPTITAGTVGQYYRGDKTWQTLDKTAVGLGNVDNTSDLNKPISTAAQTALNTKANASSLATVATSGSYTDLANKPTIPAVQVNSDWNAGSGVSQILNKPALAAVATSGSYTDLTNKPTIPTVSDATTTSKGIVQLAGDLAGTATTPTVPGLAGKEPTVAAGTTGQYYRGDKTWQTLDKTAVGLANVDNTSDLNKPISTATQTALNTKADAANVGAKVLLIDNAAALPAGTPAGVVVVVKS